MKLASFLIVFLLALSHVLVSQPTSSLEFKIDSYLKEKFPPDAPGGVVLVARGDEVIIRRAYGLADLNAGEVNSPNTIFRIGSITKQFTSTAILKLVRAGKISLNDTISKFFPGYPMGEKAITITHLLTHTSGIKSYTSLPEIVGSKESKERAYTVDEIINAFQSQPKDFGPGEDYRYNNSGYFLLGAVIEKVSGVTWAKYLEDTIFTPLEMNSTHCDDLKLNGKAKGYYKGRKKFDEADIVHPSASYAAGAMASTVDDLWKWNKAVFSGKVEGYDLLQIAWRPVRLNNGVTKPYGFGWQIADEQGERTIGHGGTIDGFQSYACYLPEKKTFVVILSNNMGADVTQYANEILNMVN